MLSLSGTVTNAFKEVKSGCLFPGHLVALVNSGIRNISLSPGSAIYTAR